jgi:hypothetical protein
MTVGLKGGEDIYSGVKWVDMTGVYPDPPYIYSFGGWGTPAYSGELVSVETS